MTRQPIRDVRKPETTPAPRVSFAHPRLHFVSRRDGGARQSPRLRLTGALVGRR